MSPRLIPLDDLGNISLGITISRYADHQGIPYRVVSVTDLEELYIGEPPAQVQLTIPDIQRYQLRENDVVIAIRGAILKSSVVTKSLQDCVSNQNTVLFRSKFKELDPLYLAVLLRSNYFEQLPSFKKSQSTTTLPAIRVSDLRNLEIPVPDLHIQRKIGQLFLATEQSKKITLLAIETRQKLANAALTKSLGMQLC